MQFSSCPEFPALKFATKRFAFKEVLPFPTLLPRYKSWLLLNKSAKNFNFLEHKQKNAITLSSTATLMVDGGYIHSLTVPGQTTQTVSIGMISISGETFSYFLEFKY